MEPRLLTVAAELAEDLSDVQYREIYDELREKCSLRQFAEFIGSTVSHAWWSKYENSTPPLALNHERRNELRRAVGMSELPLTVSQALGNVSPNAAVWALGEQPAERVVLVGGDQPQTLTLRLNGSLTVVEDAPQNADGTGVTRLRRRAPLKRIPLHPETWERLNSARKLAGLTWEEFARQWAEKYGRDDVSTEA
jgi:transcriptional regulator with XRE-family HTH domain